MLSPLILIEEQQFKVSNDQNSALSEFLNSSFMKSVIDNGIAALLIDTVVFTALGANPAMPFIGATVAYTFREYCRNSIKKSLDFYSENESLNHLATSAICGGIGGAIKYGIGKQTIAPSVLIVGAYNNFPYEYFRPDIMELEENAKNYKAVGDNSNAGLEIAKAIGIVIAIEGSEGLFKSAQNYFFKSSILENEALNFIQLLQNAEISQSISISKDVLVSYGKFLNDVAYTGVSKSGFEEFKLSMAGSYGYLVTEKAVKIVESLAAQLDYTKIIAGDLRAGLICGLAGVAGYPMLKDVVKNAPLAIYESVASYATIASSSITDFINQVESDKELFYNIIANKTSNMVKSYSPSIIECFNDPMNCSNRIADGLLKLTNFYSSSEPLVEPTFENTEA